MGIGLGLGLRRQRRLLDDVPVLDLNFSVLKSLTPSSGPTPTFSRASSGTYFDSSGVIQTASTNNGRFNHLYNGSSWVSQGLLIEEQRTNLYTYSEDAASGGSAGNATISANSVAAPDGATTADTMTSTNSTGVHYLQKSGWTVTNGATYTTSLFFKYGTHKWVQISADNSPGTYANFDIQTGSIGSVGAGVTATITNCGNGWYRCSITYTAGGINVCPLLYMVSSTSSARGESNTLTTAAYFYLWGGQMEAGAFPTSYIANTSTGSTTRSADVCTISGSNFSGIWNASEGSLVAEGYTPGSGIRTLCSADDNSANNNIILSTSTTDPKFDVKNGGASQASIDAGSITANTAFKLSACYKANDFAASIGGAAVVTDASGSIPTVDRLRIGVDQAGNYLNGCVSRIRYYNSRLINGDLQTLST